MNRLIIGAVISSMLLGGCATQSSPAEQYTAQQANTVVHVSLGVVVSVREVEIKENTSGVGTVAGGVAGSVLGSKIGGGRGSILGSIAGALGGAIGGQAMENALSKKKALEIILKMDDTNNMVAITQKTSEVFRVGEHVQLVGSDKNNARVTHKQ